MMLFRGHSLILVALLALFALPSRAAIVFYDDFESGLGSWSQTAGSGEVTITGETSNSGSFSMRIGEDTITVTSDAIDTTATGTADVTVTAWIRRGDDSFSENPDGNEDLVLEYLDNGGGWNELETFAGGDTPGQIFNRSYTLPAAASHSSFRLRFRYLQGSGNNFDYWHVDDVSVDATAAVSCTETYADEFSSQSYGNNDGSLSWSANWVEFTDNGTPASGRVWISGGQLRLSDSPNSGGEPGVYRQVDLSSYETATLTYDAGSSGTLENGDRMEVDVSANGGGSYTTLASYQNDISGSETFDLTPYISSNTRIRFRISNGTGSSNEYFSIDNVVITGDLGSSCSGPPVQTCFTDDFARATVGDDWTVVANAGSTLPGIQGGRFRLNENLNNQATAATLQRLFPAAENYVEVTFRHYAYGGSSNGTGADGVVVVFSDSSVTPQAGSYGGSLGYAQRSGGQSGFAGGWMGVGIDEYGNFANPSEGRNGGIGRRLDSVTVRGSGSGTTGYRYIDSTSTLSPGIDVGGSTPGPGYAYRIILNSRVPGQALLTVERDLTGTGNNYSPLLGPIDMLAQTGQSAVPENFYLSLTGSTGGSRNLHGFDDFQVCADKIGDVGQQIDHFELSYADPGLTCQPSEVLVRACLDAACTTEYTDPVTVTMSPSGWVGGDTQTFSGGSTTLQYQRTTTGIVNLGVQNSTPSQKPFSQNLCSRNGGGLGTNCSLTFADTGFIFDVPDLIANKPSGPVTMAAVRLDDTSQQCVPAFASVTRDIAFYSDYVNPVSTGRPVSRSVAVNSTDVGQTSGTSTVLSLDFNAQGETEIDVRYPDAGRMQLNARYEGSAVNGDSGLVMTGSDPFTSRPAGLCVSTTASCSAGNSTCSVFATAGVDFPLTLQAVGWESDADGDLCSGNIATPNYTATIPLSLALVDPVGGELGAISPTTYTHVRDASGETVVDVQLSEVGVFDITATPPSYFGMTIPAATESNVGRIIPAQFNLSVNSGALDAACGVASDFAYTGQPVGWLTTPYIDITAVNANGATTSNYTSAGYQRLSTTGITINSPVTDNIQSGTDSNLLGVSVVQNAGSLSILGPGELRYLMDSTDSVSYDKTAESQIAPFTPDLSWVLSTVQDTDSVSGAGLPSNIDPTATFDVRYGRLRLANVYGPETQSLAMTSLIETWDGSAFVTEANDSCSPFPASVMTVNGTAGGVNGIGVGGGSSNMTHNDPASAGDLDMNFSAPGAGNTGSIQVEVDLSAQPWLRYDFDQNGTLDSNELSPTATATFGQYRGHDRIIYWREVQ